MHNEPHSTFMLGDRTYDFVKKLVQIFLPAFSAAYFGLAGIWNLPEPEKVVGTLAVITTFLGICLGISTAQYNSSDKAFEGHLTVEPSEETGLPKVTGLHFNGSPEDLDVKKSITVKIIKQKASNLTENDNLEL